MQAQRATFVREMNSLLRQELDNRNLSAPMEFKNPPQLHAALAWFGTAISVIELGWGEAEHLAQTRNFFGIKPYGEQEHIGPIRVFESQLASVKSFVYLLTRSSNYAEPREWFMLATNPRERLLDYAGAASTIRGFARRFLAIYCPENENYPSLAQTILREIEPVCFEETTALLDDRPEPRTREQLKAVVEMVEEAWTPDAVSAHNNADPHFDGNAPDPTPAGEETETMTRLRIKKSWWRRKTTWAGLAMIGTGVGRGVAGDIAGAIQTGILGLGMIFGREAIESLK